MQLGIIDSVIDELDKEIGLSRLVVVHANDAKVEFESGVDRHANIGEGYIGVEGNEVPPDDWILQHKTIMHKFTEVKHFKVNIKPLSDPLEDRVNRVIPEWNDTPNLEYLTYAEMIGRLAD